MLNGNAGSDDDPRELAQPVASRGALCPNVAAEMYRELRLAPLLRQLIGQSCHLMGASGGSVSLVDLPGGRYTKMAERGALCRLGETFSLGEGVTGAVVARRRPVVLDRYSDVVSGHIKTGQPTAEGAVAAIPIWWRGDIVGVNVVFAGRARRFTPDEVDTLEALTQLAAPGVVTAGRHVPSLSNLIRRNRPAGAGVESVHTSVTEVGQSRLVPGSVADAVLDLVALVERVAAARTASARLHVAVVNRDDGLRLLVQEEASGVGNGDALATGAGWQELADRADGGVVVEHLAGWGALVQADIPAAQPRETSDWREPTPFTHREQQVLQMLAQGLTDRDVAQALVISPRTVEKHVGAVLRKTGAPSRTAAVVRALERGWLDVGAAAGG